MYYGNATGFWNLGVRGQPGRRATSRRSRARCATAGLSYAKHHVVARARSSCSRALGRTWSLFRPLDMVKINTGEDREEWVTRLGLVAYYPTLLFAIGGRGRAGRRRRARAVLWVLLVPGDHRHAQHVVTYGQTRFRAGAEPSLALLAAVGVVALVAVHCRRARPDAGRRRSTGPE